MTMPVVQTTVIRYLDKKKLNNLLKTLFPDIDYECEVSITPTFSATNVDSSGMADQK